MLSAPGSLWRLPARYLAGEGLLRSIQPEQGQSTRRALLERRGSGEAPGRGLAANNFQS